LGQEYISKVIDLCKKLAYKKTFVNSGNKFYAFGGNLVSCVYEKEKRRKTNK
jgi:hypothetical protein